MQKWQFFTEDQIWGAATAGFMRDDWLVSEPILRATYHLHNTGLPSTPRKDSKGGNSGENTNWSERISCLSNLLKWVEWEDDRDGSCAKTLGFPQTKAAAAQVGFFESGD